MTDVKGFCEPRFEAVRAALAALLDKDDVGASAAVYVDGEPVVDIWGGYADADRSVSWGRDTLTGVNSTTKNMTALCALILADRGELDLSAPVAAYWPEFAAAGKENVLVRHVLSHTAGLPDLSGPTAVEDLYDWESVTAGLAAQAPCPPRGTPVPRATLDAAAHRTIAQEQQWGTGHPAQSPPRPLPRAHVPVDLLQGRHPKARR